MAGEEKGFHFEVLMGRQTQQMLRLQMECLKHIVALIFDGEFQQLRCREWEENKARQARSSVEQTLQCQGQA